MKTVFKFEFPVNDEVLIQMPADAKIVHVGRQQPNHICLWAIVDTDKTAVNRQFSIRGTGQPLGRASDCEHLGSVFDGPFVWHVFGER